MNECLLCKRDMKVSTDTFGNGCIRNIYLFLGIKMPKKVKLREETLYKNIMRITNTRNINKKQKVWLADRYLTNQYLERITYGNFNELKTQINTDIQNIHSIKNEDELVSVKQMSLKQANDLYKKVQRFEEVINNIKRGKFRDSETIDLFRASVSFIFNMSRNKNQYENNSSKAMQYTFWQTVIETGDKYKNYHISAYFLQHSLEENPEDLLITEGWIVDSIKQDKNFQENIKNIVKKYGQNCDEFIFDSDIDKNFPMSFEDSDLYFAVHFADLKALAKKQNEKWNLEIKLHDRYDYSVFKSPSDYYNDTNSVMKSMLSSTLYNLAFASIKFKVMKEYDIDIQFEMKQFEVIE